MRALIAAALPVLAGLGLARLTGGSPRAYPVLDPAEPVTSGGVRLTVDEVARRYRPRIAALPQERPDPVTGTSYEAWWDGDDLLLTYFVTWPDEHHPLPVVHHLYGLYRWAHYRGRQDVEYVQVRVARTGEPKALRFESPAHTNPFAWAPRHMDAEVLLAGDRMVRDLAGRPGDRALSITLPAPEDGQVTLYVASWNHLLDVTPPPGGPGPVDSPVPVPRNASDYQAVAAARRGHPGSAGVETPARALAGRAWPWLVLLGPALGAATWSLTGGARRHTPAA